MISRNDKPRILFVGAFPPPERPIYGGVVSSCAALLASELPQHVDFILVDSTQISNPPPGFLVRLGLAVRRFARFCVRVVRDRPDATLIFLSTGASVVEKGMMAWFARACRVPVLLFPRAGSVIEASSRSALIRATVRCLLRSATVLLCQSTVWQRFASTQLGIAIDRTLVIENWTASPDFLAIGARRPAGAPANRPFRITFVGWVEREKGIFDLLEACRGLGDEQDYVVQIVGGGSANEEAVAFVRDHGMSGRVKFLGWLPSQQLCDVLERSDAFVLPPWAEGFPNAMVEAMAARLAVVVTRVGGIPDIVQDGVSGLLVDPKSPKALRRALGCLMSQDGTRRALADAGHVIARERFSTIAATARFLQAFKLVLPRPASPQPETWR